MIAKTFLRNAWNEPRRFLLWLTLLSMVGLGSAFFLATQTPGFSPPRWLQIFALIGLVGCVFGFVFGTLGFILSWIPPIYRLEIRLLRRRFFVLACLITFVALLNAAENWRGKRAWENFKHEWEGKGERFDFAHFIPPPVPDEQNFAMSPLLKPLFEYTRTTGHLHWNNTNGLVPLLEIRADLGAKRNSDSLALGTLEKGTFTDLQACGQFYIGNTNYPQAGQPRVPADTILLALGKFDAEMQQLAEATTIRRYSRFPIKYDFQPPSEILLPHLAPIKGLCLLFGTRAVARLETGQAGLAFDDLKVGFRLSDSIRDEPFLIDHLVRLATCSVNLQTVREGLVRHAWGDEQLLELEKYLRSLDLLAELKNAMRGERALNLAGIDYIRRQGLGENVVNYMDEENGAQSTGFGFGFMPSGWLYQNMLTLAQMHQQFTIGIIYEKQHRVSPEASHLAMGAMEALGKGFFPNKIFARMLFPAFSKTGQKSGRMQTFVDAAYVACALERFRLANGTFPEKLDALIPTFMEKIPADVIDGQPLRYRLIFEGGYRLYSIGWNGTDDGGEIVLTKGKTPSVNVTKGDWVWKYPAQ